MFEERLVGAHNSLVDAKAQARIFADPLFWLRQKPFKPCLCNRCFFCKKGLTNMYGEQPVSNKRSRISGMPASSTSEKKIKKIAITCKRM